MKLIIADTCAPNAGDAAILHGILKVLGLAFGPDAEVRVLDQLPDISKRVYPDLDLGGMVWKLSRRLLESRRYRLWRQLPARFRSDRLLTARVARNLAEYRESDLIVFAGGTYLVEHYDMDPHLRQIELAVQSGRPVVLFTQSLGPFSKPENVQRLKAVIPRVGLVLLRDELSAKHLADIGCDGPNLRVAPDAAFALAEEEALRLARARSLATQPKIAISVRSWGHFRSGDAKRKHDEYVRGIGAAVESLVGHRHAAVTFVSTCQGLEDYRYDDSRTAHEIFELLPPKVRTSVKVDTRHRTPEELLSELPGFDLVVATRMHMAILGLDAGVPVVPIAYEFKSRELFRGLGFENWVVDIEDVTPQSMAQHLEGVLGEVDQRRGELIDAIQARQSLALSVAEQLRQLVAQRPAATSS